MFRFPSSCGLSQEWLVRSTGQVTQVTLAGLGADGSRQPFGTSTRRDFEMFRFPAVIET
jgi:hypothetical protein